jgi:hypothetical protein
MALDDLTMSYSAESRPTRSERSPSIHEDTVSTPAKIASIMTTASNPVSPGPSSPPLDQIRPRDFVPPTRPSSTPFPQPELRNMQSSPADFMMGIDGLESPIDPSCMSLVQMPGVNLNDLPTEIHECIIDHLFGFRVSPSSKSSMRLQNVAWSWGTAWRYSRRKELSELALLNGVWRVLIQGRLYRHIKVKATMDSIDDSIRWFARYPHLRRFVKHIEIWFPVFQPVYGANALPRTRDALPTVTPDGLTNASYVLPRNNCSLEEAFYFISSTFPEALVLTLEGGDRKKAPRVKHFICEPQRDRTMCKISSIRTLVCKGQWNLIRSTEDFDTIASALPSLQEWHGLYSRPKSKSYLTLAPVLRKLPPEVDRLHLCLEDYRREAGYPPYYVKVANKMHFCLRLAEVIPRLEHFSFTGRVCRSFFDQGARLSNSRDTRLKSIDLTIKNCCRSAMAFTDMGSGIHDMSFIRAFEQLVLSAVRSLARFRALEFLRIRYVDLGESCILDESDVIADGWLTLSRLARASAEPIFSAPRRQVLWRVERTDRGGDEPCQTVRAV